LSPRPELGLGGWWSELEPALDGLASSMMALLAART
jgi:hypothetical protein